MFSNTYLANLTPSCFVDYTRNDNGNPIYTTDDLERINHKYKPVLKKALNSFIAGGPNSRSKYKPLREIFDPNTLIRHKFESSELPVLIDDQYCLQFQPDK